MSVKLVKLVPTREFRSGESQLFHLYTTMGSNSVPLDCSLVPGPSFRVYY